MYTMRTIYPIYYFLIINSFFLRGCIENNFPTSNKVGNGDAVVISSSEIDDTPQYNKTFLEKSPIKVIKKTNKTENETVSSNLNHHTFVTVGQVDEQYAVIIHTAKPQALPKTSNRVEEIVAQEFGDEIVEETINLNGIIKQDEVLSYDDELIVERSSIDGASIVPDTDDVMKIPAIVTEYDLFSEKGNGSEADENVINSFNTDDDYGDESFDITEIDAAYLLGKFNPATHEDFMRIPSSYASKNGMFVRKDVFEAYKKMYVEAAKKGIELKILSATRSFSSQKRIWEAKWSGRRKVEGKDLSKAIPFGVSRAKKILEFSAMPGTSRHHWGTDLDLVALNNQYFESGRGKEIYEWLDENASEYGFYQPYTAREFRETGHSEEKWHWSYLPVAKPLTKKYGEYLDNEKITGFLGEDTAEDIDIVKNFVMGVDEKCK